MELKPYQKQVISDLSNYFSYLKREEDPAKAFNNYWNGKLGPYNAISGEGMRPYQATVPGAVHLCIKVPTAGGKTFIACNALRTIFDVLPENHPKAVVWLVPWSNLLDQTVRNLSDPDHPYCQKLNALFSHRVEVYEKSALLQGKGFNPGSVREQLSIMVMNYASVRSTVRNRDDRKIFEQNGALAVFANTYDNGSHLLEGTDETALINIIRSLNPVLVVDESHNAESDLSVDMLRNLNPSFILDLTATPKKNANIISMVSAIELKKEHMVKLPVIVYNQKDKEGVIESAIHLRDQLEVIAQEQEAHGGRHIRPIVLFQAQSKTKEDNTTFDKLKAQLISIGIKEEEIKIKTANKDELKGIDLMDRECRVRYVITINALKEGWDCPYAYILASLADKSSEIDVTQILGRILRQPFVIEHSDRLLNMSYVITASAKFHDTLKSIVAGLRESGFSEKDYRSHDSMPEGVKLAAATEPEQQEIGFDTSKISLERNSDGRERKLQEMLANANAEGEVMEKELAASDGSSDIQLFSDLGMNVKQYKMREEAEAAARAIAIPQFTYHAPGLDLFETGPEGTVLLDRAVLLENFNLAEKDASVNLEMLSDIYQVDIEKTSANDIRMSSSRIENSAFQEKLLDHILTRPQEEQIAVIAHQLLLQIGKIDAVPDLHLKKYIRRILEEAGSAKLQDFFQRKVAYAMKIREHIAKLTDLHAEKQFDECKEVGRIRTKTSWKFPSAIVLNKPGADINKSLYTKEGEMNGLEQEFIMAISGLSNIEFWHRNLGRGKGFALNGFKSDHYPDFIIVTKKNKILLVETKGSDRANPDSADKLKLGKTWAELSGENYRYLMVFDKNAAPGAYDLDKALDLISKM